MFKETEKKMFVIVKNDDKGWPKFYANGKGYGMISGIIKSIGTEKKKIVPTKGDNVGKEITVYNLLVSMISQEGEFELQLPLYSGLARTTLNCLAGPDAIDEVYFSIYNNKKGFRSLSLRHSEEKEDYITPKYNWEQELGMLEIKKEKGEEKKDYDGLTDKYITEMIPIIESKLGQEEQKPVTNDDEIPF